MSKKFIFVDTDGLDSESVGAFEIADFVNSSAGVANAGDPVILDASGMLDPSMIDFGTIDHGSLSGLGDDDHTIYLLIDGTRAMTGDLDAGGNNVLITASPTIASHATNKAYVDAVATGLRPKGNVAAATTAVLSGTMTADDVAPTTGNRSYDTTLDTINWFATQGPTTIDGYALQNGDRILVKDESATSGPSAGEGRIYNGIYERTSLDVWTRSEDQDNDPLAEIVNGVFVPMVINGTVNQDVPFFIMSVGTGIDDVHTIGTDNIIWDIFTSPTQLQSGDGIDILANIISVDLLASGGLKIVTTELGVEPADFAGAGLIDDGADNLAIDWSTAFNDAKAIKAEDLNSPTNGEGASIVGIEDSAGNFTATDVEAALAELWTKADISTGDIATADGVGVTKGDLIYFSAAGIVTVMPISAMHRCVGVALNTAGAAGSVTYARWDELAEGVLSGATFGTRYYWDGSALVTTIPATSGNYVWAAGVAKNATDMLCTVEFIKKNS